MSAVKSQLKSKEQSWAWSCIWPKQWEHASCGLRSQEARIGSPGRETDTSPSIWTEKISSGELTELLSVDWKDKRNNLQQQPTPVWAVWVTGTERFGGGTLGAWAAGGGGHCRAGPGDSEGHNRVSSGSVASTETNCHCQSEEPLPWWYWVTGSEVDRKEQGPSPNLDVSL